MKSDLIRNAHILLVDDDSTSHILIKSIVKEMNCTLSSAYDGPVALDMCKENIYDLILLDIMMDSMSGIEVCEALQKIERNSKTPVIFITGRTEESIISQVYDAGAVDYIRKPFHKVELQMRIRTHLKLSNAMHDLEHKNDELTEAVNKIESLQGIIPICSNCKKIRDDKGYWNRLEKYIEEHSLAEFSHSICENCANELYGKKDWYLADDDSEDA